MPIISVKRENNSNVTPLARFTLHLLGYVLRPKARGSVVVKAVCYKSEGSGFETR
jgi:hypothetical protein